MGKGRWAERRAHWFSKGTQRGREGVTAEGPERSDRGGPMGLREGVLS